MDELKPCPFCCASAEVVRVYHNPDAKIESERELWDIVHSGNWGCPVKFNRSFATEAEAITAWNTRTNHHAHDNVVEVDWRKLAINLAMREADYRLNHDVHGDGSAEAGRSWDLMRRSGDQIREIALQARPDNSPDTALVGELEALAEKATPGPWEWDAWSREKAIPCFEMTPENVALIVTLRNNLPTILTALRTPTYKQED